MKKTLTVNLGGTVFHIDEDAYALLDNYLSNLRQYFRAQSDAQEIVSDIECRISELFLEKINAGQQVITIADVEGVIERMGKPEEFDSINEGATAEECCEERNEKCTYTIDKRLYRNPDDKILGGVFSGLAAYTGWDVTLIRLIATVILVFGYGVLVPIYIVMWIVIPPACTATEKLSMRGEAINIDSIGKTVTDGFEKTVNGVNDFVNSGKPRTWIQKVADSFVGIVGIILKVVLIILAVVFSPILFVLAIVLIALLVGGISMLFGGGSMLMSYLTLPHWLPMALVTPPLSIWFSLAIMLTVTIPVAGIVYAILQNLFNWSPLKCGVKWTFFLLWLVGFVGMISCFCLI